MPDHGTPYYSTLLGHNGPHTLKVNNMQDSSLLIQNTSTATFACDELTYGAVSHSYGMSHSITIDKAQDKANVHNVVITSCKAHDKNEAGVTVYNPDYLKFDPESTDALRRQPKITFNVEDLGDPHRYRWWLWLKPTREEQNSVELTGILSGPGEKTVTINPTTPEAGVTQDHDLTVWGTYTFELRVQEIENNSTTPVLGPWQELRSARLFIPPGYNDPQTNEWKAGHRFHIAYDETAQKFKAKASYVLNDAPAPQAPASNVAIDVLDSQMKLKTAAPTATSLNIFHHYPNLYALGNNDASDEWRGIFAGVDKHALEYRDHKNKRMPVVNQKADARAFHIEDDWLVIPAANGQPEINCNPRARSQMMHDSFLKGFTEDLPGWRVITADDDPEQVDPNQCKSFTTGPFGSDEERGALSTREFFYKPARHIPKPALSPSYKFGKYVHVFGVTYPGPNEPYYGISKTAHRYGCILTQKMRDDGLTDSDIENVTVHEVGHQFGINHFGVPAPFISDPQEHNNPTELNAYKNGTMETLKKLRLLKPGADPNDRDSYYLCVMWPIYEPVAPGKPTKDTIDPQGRFCEWHKEKIAKYNWATQTIQP